MEQFEAEQKVFKIPELVETFVSLLDPLSALRLIQSQVVDKDTLKKSLSSEAWNNLIRRSSRTQWMRQLQEGEVKNLVSILKLIKVDEPRTFVVPLLDLICESSVATGWNYVNKIHLICPMSHPAAPLVVSTNDFLLLEFVEAAFGTAEQSIVQVRTRDEMEGKLLSAISSRIFRQKEEVTSIDVRRICLKNQNNIDAFLNLLQAQKITIEDLTIPLIPANSINQDGLKALARGLKEKGRADLKLGSFGIRMTDVTEGMKDTIKDFWEAVDYGIWVCNDIVNLHDQPVMKSSCDWEAAWTRLQEILNEIEVKRAKGAESDTSSEEESSDEDSASEGDETE